MKKTFLKIATILVISLTTLSCSKEGAAGKDGSNGTNGTNGTNGQTGTANVIYSNWINQNWNSSDLPTSKWMSIPEARITSTFFDNGGSILMFYRFQTSTIYPMPYQETNWKVIRKFVVFVPGFISARLESTAPQPIPNDANTYTEGLTVPQFKYVLIPGGVPANRGTNSPEYNKMSYHEICTKFNIPE